MAVEPWLTIGRQPTLSLTVQTINTYKNWASTNKAGAPWGTQLTQGSYCKCRSFTHNCTVSPGAYTPPASCRTSSHRTLASSIMTCANGACIMSCSARATPDGGGSPNTSSITSSATCCWRRLRPIHCGWVHCTTSCRWRWLSSSPPPPPPCGCHYHLCALVAHAHILHGVPFANGR